MIAFTLPGKLQGKERHRTGRYGTYTPKNTVNYEQLVRLSYLAKQGRPLDLTRPVLIELDVYHGVPKSASKRATDAMLEKSVFPMLKPDGDNLEKCILDGLTGVAYKDDKQVIGVAWRKYYAVEPRVEVRIWTL